MDLRDNTGLPITDATVKLSYFHKAVAHDVSKVQLTRTDQTYAAPVKVTRAGFYTVDVAITRGSGRYVDTKDLFIR